LLRLKSLFLLIMLVTVPVPVVSLTLDEIPQTDPGIATGDALYSLDLLFDDLSLKFWEVMQALRVVDDDKVAKEMLKVIAERKAELKYLEDKGRINTREYLKLKERLQERIRSYEECTKPKLSITYTIEGYDVSVVIKNIWDREITYVTGGIRGESDSGKKIDYQSPIPYPLNLKPGEERLFSIRIPEEYAGNWTITIHIVNWDGKRLIKETFNVTIPQ